MSFVRARSAVSSPQSQLNQVKTSKEKTILKRINQTTALKSAAMSMPITGKTASRPTSIKPKTQEPVKLWL